MKKERTLKSINHSYHAHMKSLTSKGREQEILAALRNGKNTYMRMDRLESSSFDSSWIEVIEDVIYDLGQIISNPRQVTKTEGNIVPIELAKKTGAESVQHLASHTQYIKEIDEYGNIIPSKILSMANEDDIKTYENRFIATFVRRLVLFIGKRYDFVSKFAELHDESVLMFKNKSFVDGAEVEIETKIRINHKSDDDMAVKNNEYIERIKQVRQYILYFYSSDFMKKLKTEKDVHNPILQTNIIRKNPLYHHCYEVYRFIERYEHLGVKYKVDEQYSVFTDTELAEINNTLFANYITLKGKERSSQTKGSNRVYKPKILTSYDDEAFIYGPLFAGPIEFLRTDEPYQRYLDSKIRKDLPLHPTKRDKEYYADEYAAKAEHKENLKQKQDLIKRRNKEIAAFEKMAAKIDQEREEARLKLLEQEKQVIKKEEDDMLAIARAEIIAGSLEDKENEKAFEEQKQKEEEIKVVEMSHPHQDPVTYEEATLEIWPALANAPTLRVPSEEELAEPAPQLEPAPDEEEPVVEEPIVEEPVQEEISEPEEVPEEEPQPVPADIPEYEHPYTEPVSYDEAALEIWPALKDAPALRVAPKEEPAPAEEAPLEEEASEPEQVQEEQTQPVPADVPEYEHPYTEPVSYEEAALEIWPALKDAPALRVAPKEEEQPAPAPKEEKKAAPKAKKAKKKEQPVVEPAPIKEEPIAEPAPIEEQPAPLEEAPVVEEPAEEQPQVEEPILVEEKPEEEEAIPVKEEPDNEEVIPVRTVEPKVYVKPREKIPGRFIVKTMQGYYVSDKEYSHNKEDAKIFDDFNLAKDIKKERGGKIVKL